MRSMWTRGLAVALGLVASAQAQNAPIATIGRPVAATIGRPVALPTQPAALDRPVARIDGPVKPVSFDRPVVRGVSPDPTPAKPMPTGPGIDPAVLGMYGWSRPEEPTTAPAVIAAPSVMTTAAMTTAAMTGGPGSPILPPPNASPLPGTGPVLGGPIMSSGPIISGPVGGGPGVASPGPVVGVPMGNCDPCPPGCGPGGSAACGPGGSAACCPGGVCNGMGVSAAGGGHDPFSNRWYVGAEYLLWKVKADQTPALVTAAPFGGNASLVPGTAVLYGGPVNDGPRSGGRVTGGWWLGEDRCWGVEASAFVLAKETTSFVGGGNELGNVVGRPFNDIGFGGVPSFELVSGTFGPRALRGTVSVEQTSRLWGYELNLKRNWLSGASYSLDALVGFRHLELDEGLSIREDLFVVQDLAPPAGLPGGTLLAIRDQFSSRSRFYGGQVGLAGELWLYERLSLGGSVKVGIGYTNARTSISGSTLTLLPTGEVGFGAGGLLAQGSNSGAFTRDTFSVVPEVGLNLGYYVTDRLRLSVGYNFLYWSNVARVGEQVPTQVNALNAFGNPAPTAPFTQPVNRLSNFWAHGITAGLEFRF